jgi:parallel beta-helix repeat protein
MLIDHHKLLQMLALLMFGWQIAVFPVNAAVTPVNCVSPPSSNRVFKVTDYGAIAGDNKNDTVAFQAAADAAAGTGGTVLVPPGTYTIDMIKRVFIRSHTTFSMQNGAILKGIPNNSENYGVLRIENETDINVIGGTLIGDVGKHLNSGGEWGQGLEIYNSKNVVVQGVTSYMWGDGFYVSKNASNIKFCNVTADKNRRQGLSVTGADGLIVMNSIFQNTNGTYPSAGIDIEPDEGDSALNITIINCQVNNNAGSGIYASFPSGYDPTTSFIKKVVIDSNNVFNNGVVGAYSAAIYMSRQNGAHVTNNIVTNNVQDGIVFEANSTNNTVLNNTVTGSGYKNTSDSYIGNGILLYDDSTNNTVMNNHLTKNLAGIIDLVGGNIIKSNTVQ